MTYLQLTREHETRDPFSVDDVGDDLRVGLAGQIDRTACESPATRTLLHRAGTARSVHVDLGRVVSLDESGVSFLVRLRRRTQAGGVEMAVVNVPPGVLRVLDRFGVAPYLNVER